MRPCVGTSNHRHASESKPTSLGLASRCSMRSGVSRSHSARLTNANASRPLASRSPERMHCLPMRADHRGTAASATRQIANSPSRIGPTRHRGSRIACAPSSFSDCMTFAALADQSVILNTRKTHATPRGTYIYTGRVSVDKNGVSREERLMNLPITRACLYIGNLRARTSDRRQK